MKRTIPSVKRTIPSDLRKGYTLVDVASRNQMPIEIDILDVVRSFRRHKMVFVLIVMTITAISAIVIAGIPSRFVARTLMTMEPQVLRVLRTGNVVPGPIMDNAAIESEVAILQSRSLVGKVVDRLGLVDDPEFNPALRPKKIGIQTYLNPFYYIRELGLFAYLPRSWVALFERPTPEADIPQDSLERHHREVAIDSFLRNLTVRSADDSFVATIEFYSPSSSKSALIANTLAELYLVEQLEAKYEATRRATTWLNERLAELQEEVKQAESAVARFRQTAGLSRAEGSTVTDQQLSELNTQLVLAQVARAEAEARLRQIRSLLGTAGGIESAPEVLDSPMMLGLKRQETTLMRREAELSSTYRDLHPVMINTRAELRDLRAKIELETERIVRGLANHVDIAMAREVALQNSLDDLRSEAALLDRSAVRLRALGREAEATRTLYEAFLSRFKEVSGQQDLRQSDARIISKAFVPRDPMFPRRKRLVVFVFFISSLFGVVVVFILDNLDTRVRSAEQIESITGLRVLGLLPVIRGFALLRRWRGESILQRAGHMFYETVHTLNTMLSQMNTGAGGGVVLVTSSFPGEGTTLVSASMAMEAARSGMKCLLVDCNIRRSNMHALVCVENSTGLSDLIFGDHTFDTVVQTESSSGLDVLTCGTAGSTFLNGPNAEDAKDNLSSIFGSDEIRNLFRFLRTDYDFVVVAGPPVLIASDAWLLSQVVDRTIFIVSWGLSRRECVLTAVKKLLNSGANIAGIVFNSVNMEKYMKYNFETASRYSIVDTNYY